MTTRPILAAFHDCGDCDETAAASVGSLRGAADPLSVAERIHDGPLQIVGALGLRLAALTMTGSADRTAMAELHRLNSRIGNELNRLIAELSNADTATEECCVSFDLAERIDGLAREFRRSSSIDFQLGLDPDHLRFSGLVGVILVRSIRELLNNVRKHSHASRVVISSALLDDGSVEIRVSDDGIGLSNIEYDGPAAGDGFGLWSIEQRLREIDAWIDLESRDGLDVKIVLPPGTLSPG